VCFVCVFGVCAWCACACVCLCVCVCVCMCACGEQAGLCVFGVCVWCMCFVCVFDVRVWCLSLVSTCVCVYVCMHVYFCSCVSVGVCLCVCVCSEHVRLCVFWCVCLVSGGVWMRVCVNEWMRGWVCECVYWCVRACVQRNWRKRGGGERIGSKNYRQICDSGGKHARTPVTDTHFVTHKTSSTTLTPTLTYQKKANIAEIHVMTSTMAAQPTNNINPLQTMKKEGEAQTRLPKLHRLLQENWHSWVKKPIL